MYVGVSGQRVASACLGSSSHRLAAPQEASEHRDGASIVGLLLGSLALGLRLVGAGLVLAHGGGGGGVVAGASKERRVAGLWSGVEWSGGKDT
jgi:hypothetical protein